MESNKEGKEKEKMGVYPVLFGGVTDEIRNEQIAILHQAFQRVVGIGTSGRRRGARRRESTRRHCCRACAAVERRETRGGE